MKGNEMSVTVKPTREEISADVIADSLHDLAPEPGVSAEQSKSNWRAHVMSCQRPDGTFDTEKFFGGNRKGLMEYNQFVNKFDAEKHAKARKRRIIRR